MQLAKRQMADMINKDNGENSRKRLSQAVTLTALTIAPAHIVWPKIKIDAVTLILLVIAVLPWIAPIFRSLEFPGGWKIQFQDLEKTSVRAKEAGLLASPSPPDERQFSFQQIVETDPNLALAGLRIEIEKRLLDLAQKRGIEVRGRGLVPLLRTLTQNQVLTPEASSVLVDMTGLMNSAVHGASVDSRAAQWAIGTGPKLLKALDDLAAEK